MGLNNTPQGLGHKDAQGVLVLTEAARFNTACIIL